MPFHFINLGPKSHKFGKSNRPKWYQKPIMKSAIYTDLQRGAWHIAFYTLVRKFFYDFIVCLKSLLKD